MGYWDCPGCGQKRIQGPERSCPGCGRPRDADVRFYTDDAAPVVEVPEQVARAKAGADWQCPYCGSDNQMGRDHCVGCGATHEGAKVRTERVILDRPIAESPRSKSEPRKSRGAVFALALLVVIALLGFGIYRLFIHTKPLEVQVTHSVWVKSLDIERLQTEVHEAWRDEAPSGAREIRRTTAQRSKHVQAGH
jgi:uncharacterized membrane protein YvbJ